MNLDFTIIGIIVLARDKVWANPKLQELLNGEISRRVDMNTKQLKQYELL